MRDLVPLVDGREHRLIRQALTTTASHHASTMTPSGWRPRSLRPRALGLAVGYTIVKQIVREWRRRRQEVFVPLVYRAGDLAEVDFFEVLVDTLEWSSGRPRVDVQRANELIVVRRTTRDADSDDGA
jgi:hypothetical protein